MSCRVVVRTVEAGTHAVVVDRSEQGVVGVLKARLEELTGVPAQRQRLLHRGRELTDEEASAESLGWEENVVLHMVTRVAPPPPGPSPGGQQQQQELELPGFDATAMLPPGLADSIASFAESLQQNLSGQAGMAGPFTAVNLDDGAFRSRMSQVTDPIGGSLLSGRVPSLDEEGNMRLGSAFDALNQLLIRLEEEDTREDRVPAVQETSLELFRDQEHSREFAAAVTQFLQACRSVLTQGDAGLNRETRQVVNRVFVAAGQDPLPLGVQSFPVHGMNGDDDDDDGDNASSEWVQNISHEDLIVVAAVTVGVLTQRFMRVLGQTEAPSGILATVLRTAERLRSMSSVSNHEETVRQIRLVGGYLTRLAVSGAELGRSMAYLVSALTDNNLFFLQLYPGYIQMEDDLPRPNVGILHNMEAHRVMSLVPEITGGVPTSTSMAGVVSMAVPMGIPIRPPGTATDAGAQQGGAPGAQQQGNTPNAPRVHVHPRVHVRMAGAFPGMSAPPPRPTQGTGARSNSQESAQATPSAAEEIRRAIPQVEEILGSLGGSQGGQNLANIFSSALRGIASTDINAILNEIREAIRRGLSAAAAQLRSTGNQDASSQSLNTMISVALPEIMNEVGNVLRQRFAQMMNDASQEAAAEETARDDTVTPPQDTATAVPPPPAATEEQQPLVNNDEQAGLAEKKEEKKEEAIKERGESSSMGQTSKKNAKKPVGLGGGLKRRKVAGKKEEGSQESRKPTPASGSSMQNILGQLAGSASSARRSGSSGDAGNLGALLNSAGPLLGQMFGGSQGQAQEAPVDIEQVLEKEITSEEERKKWQQHIERCASAQPSTDDHPGEAYLSSIPSTTGAQGILDAIFGDE